MLKQSNKLKLKKNKKKNNVKKRCYKLENSENTKRKKFQS